MALDLFALMGAWRWSPAATKGLGRRWRSGWRRPAPMWRSSRDRATTRPRSGKCGGGPAWAGLTFDLGRPDAAQVVGRRPATGAADILVNNAGTIRRAEPPRQRRRISALCWMST